MKSVFFILALIISTTTLAAPVEYEYQVVMIERPSRTVGIDNVDGAWLIPNKTKAMNDLMAQGWEVVSIVAGSMDTERVYIKRAVK